MIDDHVRHENDRQLVMKLDHTAEMTAQNFLIGSCNESAYLLLDRWQEWSGKRLVIYGCDGSGKTHLTEIWRCRTGAVTMECGVYDPSELPDSKDNAFVIMEDVDSAFRATGNGVVSSDVPSKERLDLECSLLHTLNLCDYRQRYVVITSREPPARWGIIMPELSSRLSAATIVKISAPDDNMIEELLAGMFAERQIRVSERLVRYLAMRLERDHSSLKAAVDALDHYGLVSHRPLTISSARDILGL